MFSQPGSGDLGGVAMGGGGTRLARGRLRRTYESS